VIICAREDEALSEMSAASSSSSGPIQPRPEPIRNGPLLFSHPAEEAFADVLDFYTIEWEYEPTTFPWSGTRRGASLLMPELPEILKRSQTNDRIGGNRHV
jgi:hypothetical protein